MANKKQSEKKEEVITKKKNQGKTTTTKKTNSNSKTQKQTSKKSTTKKTVKVEPKKTASTKTVTKNKTTEVKVKNDKKVLDEEVKVKSVELAKVLDQDNKDIIIEKNKQETAIKIEDAKFPRKKDKKLVAIGIIMVILGIISLFVSLVANRIVDREFLSDNAITFMMISSIIIEGFGAVIIINES